MRMIRATLSAFLLFAALFGYAVLINSCEPVYVSFKHTIGVTK